MPFRTPDDWRKTLPLVYDTASSLDEHHSHLSHVAKELSNTHESGQFQELITDNFLFSLYHACVESFQSNHKKPVIPGLDDLENTLIKLMDTHLQNTQDIFSHIPIDDIKQHLELIDKRMEAALESGEMDDCASIAGNIKTMTSLLSYYCEYRYAFIELEKQFGTNLSNNEYIEDISHFLSKADLELDEAVQFYHHCVYSRVFLGQQDKLEQLFTTVFDALIEKESINKHLDLTIHTPHQLNDIQTLIMFKQATQSNTEHGYFSQLGLFIKHANNLLLNQTSNPYYLQLFINNMSITSDFGHDSPILLSLKKIQLTTDMLKTLLTIPQFNSLMAPYIYNPYFSLNKLNDWIITHTSLLTKCVNFLSNLDNIKLYYLYPSEELLKHIHRQRFHIGELDISQIDIESFVPILYFMTHDNYLYQKHHMLNIMVFTHEAFCNIHENISELESLARSYLPNKCPLFIGIQHILFGIKLLDALTEMKEQTPENFHATIYDIQAALQQKNISMMARLHQVKNICEDHIKIQDPNSPGHHILQQILKGMHNLQEYKDRSRSIWSIFFREDRIDTSHLIKAIYPIQNGPKLTSSKSN